MSLNLWDIMFHAINAIILIFAYKYFLYVPVRKFLNARTEKLKAEREEIESTRTLAQNEEKEARKALDEARIQATKTLQENHARLELECADMIKQAQNEAARVVAEAREYANDVIERSRDEIRTEAVELAMNIAEKVLEREINEADNKKMIDDFLANVTGKG